MLAICNASHYCCLSFSFRGQKLAISDIFRHANTVLGKEWFGHLNFWIGWVWMQYQVTDGCPLIWVNVVCLFYASERIQ